MSTSADAPPYLRSSSHEHRAQSLREQHHPQRSPRDHGAKPSTPHQHPSPIYGSRWRRKLIWSVPPRFIVAKALYAEVSLKVEKIELASVSSKSGWSLELGSASMSWQTCSKCLWTYRLYRLFDERVHRQSLSGPRLDEREIGDKVAVATSLLFDHRVRGGKYAKSNEGLKVDPGSVAELDQNVKMVVATKYEAFCR
ncbi:hypothetical protein BDY21DRAFT_367336 [Lineolata rhizophorae]|uniref:Uncharacterized protein n=1 Tax=Lineolata rhizophorae TaxID=578093 RepID=A0A6A6NN99_9PEZI|nr:hypothetical protein BDY21DRAFT_367336 [Lineolata rhizophorae]